MKKVLAILLLIVVVALLVGAVTTFMDIFTAGIHLMELLTSNPTK